MRLGRLIVAAALIARCSISPVPSEPVPTPEPTLTPRAWPIEVIAQGEGTTLEAVVHDWTGLVEAVEPGQSARSGVASLGVQAQPSSDTERGLIVSWSVSRCATSSRIALRRTDGLLSITLAPSAPMDCDLIAVTYGLLVTLSEPVPINQVVVGDDGATGRSWGVIANGSDGLNRAVLVLDETRSSTLVAPGQASNLLGVEAGVAASLGADRASAVLAWASRNCDDVMNVSASRSGDDLSMTVELSQSANSQACRTAHTQSIAIRFPPNAGWEKVHSTLRP